MRLPSTSPSIVSSNAKYQTSRGVRVRHMIVKNVIEMHIAWAREVNMDDMAMDDIASNDNLIPFTPPSPFL